MGMSEEPVVGEIDRRRVRIGLAILGLVVAVALIGAFAFDNPTAQTVMTGIALFTIVRAYFFTRRLRRQRDEA